MPYTMLTCVWESGGCVEARVSVVGGGRVCARCEWALRAQWQAAPGRRAARSAQPLPPPPPSPSHL